MELYLIDERILIEPVEEEKFGSLIIPDVAKDKPSEGVIECVGDAITNPHLKKGARVLFNKYAGHEYRMNGKKYRIIMLEDIIGILTT